MLNIKTGAKMVVRYKDEHGLSPVMEMASAFESSEEDGTFLVAAPIYKEIQFPLPDGEEIDIMYFEASAFFSFRARTRERIKRGDLYFLRMQQLSEPIRTQRRTDFRLPVILMGHINKAMEDRPGSVKHLPARTVDVSGGGVALRTGMSYDVNEKTEVRLPLGKDGATLTIPVVVRRCSRMQDSEQEWRYLVGLQFLFKTPAEKESIVAYVFQLERELRKSHV